MTGADGFIGSHLVPALTLAGFRVVAVVGPRAKGRIECERQAQEDIAIGGGLAAALREADVIVHLAARNHIPRGASGDPLSEYRRVNVDGTRNVIRAGNAVGATTFIHISSVKAVGEGSDRVLDEDEPCNPSTPYGVSKMESEGVVRSEAAGRGMRIAILRLPMVYGPAGKGNFFRMIRWAERGLPFPLVMPDNHRSTAYVGNVIAAILALMENAGPDRTPEGTFFVKDDADSSTRMIYSLISRELDKVPRFLPLPGTLAKVGRAMSGDFRKIGSSFRVSDARIRERLGFVPPFSREEGVARTVRWYKRQSE